VVHVEEIGTVWGKRGKEKIRIGKEQSNEEKRKNCGEKRNGLAN
jgi:hypothetical protein